MTSVHLITHCWAVAHPDYAKLLTAQLSSLFLWTPRQCRVDVDVFTGFDDNLTQEVVMRFQRLFTKKPALAVGYTRQPLRLLFRRAIGRNQAALRSTADIVIFSDADMLYGPDCLDTLAREPFDGQLVFPRITMTHPDVATGEQDLTRITPGEVFCPDVSLFVPVHHRYAAGNCQIVLGETARRSGYLNAPEWEKWQRPRPDETPFPDTREDAKFRKACGGSKPVDLPDVYRLRHVASSYEKAENRGLRMWMKG